MKIPWTESDSLNVLLLNNLVMEIEHLRGVIKQISLAEAWSAKKIRAFAKQCLEKKKTGGGEE